MSRSGRTKVKASSDSIQMPTVYDKEDVVFRGNGSNNSSNSGPIIVEASSDTIRIPSISDKEDVPFPSNDGLSSRPNNNSTNLPLGIRLTGGVKLRRDGLTGKGVKVAVIDSGVDELHPSFNGRVTKQTWFRHGTPLSQDDHGTHVAGTVHMMAPDAEIYDYRVFGKDGIADVERAIVISIFEAVFDDVDIINMSIGGRWPNNDIRGAMSYAHSKGIIIVVSAGNEGDDNVLTNDRSFPALWDEAVSVAAVSKANNLPVAKFSNSNPQLDYSGIGVEVVSFKPNGGFQRMSGTSMASPHVCGLIAALLDKENGVFTNNGSATGNNTSYATGRVVSNIIEEGGQPIWTEAQTGYNTTTTNNNGSNGVTRTKEFDSYVRRVLNQKFLIDIGLKRGRDNATGLGFLTYLTKQEFDQIWE